MPRNDRVPSAILAELGVNIARYRKIAKLTQAALGEVVDIKSNSIARYEQGCGSPSLITVIRIALALGVEVGDLLPSRAKMMKALISPRS